MKQYQLLNKSGLGIRVIIQECAKEDFMKVMDWSEWEFHINTMDLL